MTTLHSKRLSKTLKRLRKEQHGSALLLSSAGPKIRSRDLHYPYRAASNLFYLTGCKSEDVLLLVSPRADRPILFAPQADPHKILWEGESANLKPIARALDAELVTYKDSPVREVLSRLKGVEQIFYHDEPGSLAHQVVQEILSQPSSVRSGLPRFFVDADQLLAGLRLYKDRSEIESILRSAQITAEAMHEALVFLNPRHREYQLAASIDFWFSMAGATPGFATIVASGPSAATLHYHELSRPFRQSDMVLIDCGAEKDLYSADISRTLPAGGVFESWARDLYPVVLEAQYAAIGKVAHGVKIETVYNAAARALTQGLIDLKVIRGPLSKALEKKTFRPFFPHGIGHSLGIDVHDVGNLRGNTDAVLEEGMVITVEPGLYFAKPIKQLPACGVRIEDDVVVTRQGCRILTTHFPKEIDDIEALLGEVDALAKMRLT